MGGCISAFGTSVEGIFFKAFPPPGTLVLKKPGIETKTLVKKSHETLPSKSHKFSVVTGTKFLQKWAITHGVICCCDILPQRVA